MVGYEKSLPEGKPLNVLFKYKNTYSLPSRQVMMMVV